MQEPESIPKNSVDTFRIKASSMSFYYAINGIILLIRQEYNARIHLVANFIVLLAGGYLQINAAEWRWLVLAIGLVWLAEAFNTAIETLCDLVHPGFHPRVKQIKDVAAGAVLFAALTAAVIGVTVFRPYIAG